MTTNSLHCVTGSPGWLLVSVCLWLSQRALPEQNLVGIPPVSPASLLSLVCPASSGSLICKDPTTFITSPSRQPVNYIMTCYSQQPFQFEIFIIRPFLAISRLQLSVAVAKQLFTACCLVGLLGYRLDSGSKCTFSTIHMASASTPHTS